MDYSNAKPRKDVGNSSVQFDSSQVLDSDGHHLQASIFPYHLEKRASPKAGFGAHNSNSMHLLSESSRIVGSSSSFEGNRKTTYTSNRRAKTASSQISPSKYPSTYMIVDFANDRKTLVKETNSSDLRIANVHPVPTAYSAPEIPVDPLFPEPTLKNLRMRNPAQPLQQSFIQMKKKQAIIDSISEKMYNRRDEETQTEVLQERLEFNNLSDYSDWSNLVAEPFFMVSS